MLFRMCICFQIHQELHLQLCHLVTGASHLVLFAEGLISRWMIGGKKINWKVWHDALQRGNKWKGQGLVHYEAFCALDLNQRCWKGFSHWQAWPLWLSGAVWLQRANRFKIWLYKHWPYSNRLWWVSLSNPHIRVSHTFSHFSLNFYHDSPRLCLVQLMRKEDSQGSRLTTVPWPFEILLAQFFL